MQSVLIHNDLWYVVNSTKDSEDMQWDRKDAKAKAEITLSVKPSNYRLFKNASTAADIWNELKEAYEKKGPPQLVTTECYGMKDQTEQSMSSYLEDFFSTVDTLTNLGLILDDKFISVMLLVSLGESYEMFVVAITSHNEIPLPSVLKSKILEEELRRSNGNSITTNTAFGIKYSHIF